MVIKINLSIKNLRLTYISFNYYKFLQDLHIIITYSLLFINFLINLNYSNCNHILHSYFI